MTEFSLFDELSFKQEGCIFDLMQVCIHICKNREKEQMKREHCFFFVFFGQRLTQEQREYWELINRKATIAICLVCVPPLSEVYSTYSSIHQHTQKHIPLSQLPSMKTWSACVHGFHCQCIKMPCSCYTCCYTTNGLIIMLFIGAVYTTKDLHAP